MQKYTQEKFGIIVISIWYYLTNAVIPFNTINVSSELRIVATLDCMWIWARKHELGVVSGAIVDPRKQKAQASESCPT